MGHNMKMAAAIVLLGLSVSLPSVELTEEDMQVRPLPISMSQAVEAAESAMPGQAIDAQLEITAGRPVYEIHMLSVDRGVNRIQVDAQDGEVAIVVDGEEKKQMEEEIVPSEKGGAI